MALLLYLLSLMFLLGSVITKPQIAPELFLNRLNISYGINYKYNGELNHNIDRVWVVTKIKIPKYEEITFSDIGFGPECSFLDSFRHDANYRDNVESVKQLCRDSAPLIQLFQYKEKYKQQLITKLLDEDIEQALQGTRLRHSRSASFPEDPQLNKTYAHNSSALTWTRRGFVNKFLNVTPPSYPYRARGEFAAFIPALASLATIAGESIGSFLQKKRNAALAKGITAIQSDQSLAWNSIRQLEDDF